MPAGITVLRVMFLSVSTQDTNGRRFYINHLTRVTSLRRPVSGASTPETTPTQTSGGEGVAIEQEAESEVELPPGWEERTVSYIATRKTSEAILKRHKE